MAEQEKDIVERLRYRANKMHSDKADIMRDAANEIERLRAEIKQMKGSIHVLQSDLEIERAAGQRGGKPEWTDAQCDEWISKNI